MKQKRILIVDDEPEIVHVLEIRLRAYGLETLTAFDGEEALNRIRRDQPDLILLDIHLPAVNGLTILEQIPRDEAGRSIPIIAITADHRVELEQRCREIGCVAFFRKPYDPPLLISAIDEALRIDHGDNALDRAA